MNFKKYKIFLKSLIILLLIGFIFITSCRKDENYINDSSVKLIFSDDLVTFDTVFSTIGSTTKLFKVYNSENKPLIISSINVAGGTSSNFKINVDGISGTSFKDVEILSNDSLWIFVRVTVDPGNQNTPFVIDDSIVFNTNGNIQSVKLNAWGQDAYYHTPTEYIQGLPPFSYAGCKTPWSNDKPHVIYGYTVVDTDSTLIIPAGTKIHLYKNSVIWIYDGGSLKVNGEKDNPVYFQGTRLEEYYKNIPGQWNKIWLSAGSKDNIIEHAIIKNGSIGIQCDTLGSINSPTLKLNNTIIKNMSIAALWGQGSHIWAVNSVFANCGLYNIVLSIGGKYNFKHCTAGNFWNYNTRSTPSVLLNNYYKDYLGNIQIRSLDSAYFGNCIIYGNINDEIGLDRYSASSVFNYKFDHCLIKTTLNISDTTYFKSVINNTDPLFTDNYTVNYSITSNSPVINAGKQLNIQKDILGNNRDAIPDIGAYEYLP